MEFFLDGVVMLDNSYLKSGKIFGQIVCSFRYGRKEDEVMGLRFQKDMYLASSQIYPPLDTDNPVKLTKIQVNISPFKKVVFNDIEFNTYSIMLK